MSAGLVYGDFPQVEVATHQRSRRVLPKNCSGNGFAERECTGQPRRLTSSELRILGSQHKKAGRRRLIRNAEAEPGRPLPPPSWRGHLPCVYRQGCRRLNGPSSFGKLLVFST